MIAEAREAVEKALIPLGLPVHRYVSGTVTPSAAVLVWGSPLYQHRTASRAVIGIEVRLVVSSAPGGPAQAVLDTLVDEAVTALVGAGIQVDSVAAPTQDPDTATLSAVLATFVSVERK